jgi:multidrug efflux pump subunit AcrB
LMPSDITALMAEQNIQAAPGKFGEQSDQSYEYVMRYKGRLKTPEEFGNIIIKIPIRREIFFVSRMWQRSSSVLVHTVNGQPR